MAGTVFILGAGASFKAGAPLMGNFLDVAEGLLGSSGIQPDDKMHIQRVFKGVDALQKVYAKSTIDSDNLESVYSAFEMAEVLGQLGDLPTEDIADLTISMRRLIVTTLENTIEFLYDGRRINPPRPYLEFAYLLRNIRQNYNSEVTVITFNYDLALDFALYMTQTPHSYCLEGDYPKDTIKVLKLHGSTNWLPSREPGKITAWTVRDYFRMYSWNPALEPGSKAKLFTSSKLGDFCKKEGNQSLIADSVIVPPTSSKVQHYRQIQNVWSAAARALAEAENIFVSGYSLPATDTFFRYLFALGSTSSTRIKRFWVFDPETTGMVKGRFESLLGPTTLLRFRFRPLTFGGESSSCSPPCAITEVASELKVPINH